MPTLADQIAPKPQQPSGLGGWLASIGDEMAGAFARYGRRSGAQRDASLELLNQASAPGTDPIMGAGQKLLGLAGLITHPLAFFPTREEWDQRLQAAGNDGRMSRSIGGFLSDLPNLIDPQMAAGGAVLATAPLAAKMLNKADDVADAGIIAYHGSPHSFDKFDMSKIGTGEGAQAYGHGLYFAQHEGTAQSYRDVLSSNRAPSQEDLSKLSFDDQMKVSDAIQSAGEVAGFNTSSPDAFWMVINKLAGHESKTMHPAHDKAMLALDEVVKHVPEDVKSLVAQSVTPAKGSMYQVKINATPEEFLNWDIPLSQQPKKVQEALRGLDPSLFAVDTWTSKLDGAKTKGRTVSYGPDNRTGEAAARAFEENLGGPEMAAEKLKAAGIKGVRYLDQGSRNAGGWHITPPDQTVSGKWMVKSSDYNSKGMHFDNEEEARAALNSKIAGQTYNYVVFDDKLITILKKYGIPMTAGAGGAMMVAGQDMPPEFASQMGGT